jgi:hypothetical protein
MIYMNVYDHDSAIRSVVFLSINRMNIEFIVDIATSMAIVLRNNLAIMQHSHISAIIDNTRYTVDANSKTHYLQRTYAR